MLPASRPQLPSPDIRKVLKHYRVEGIALLGVRGYFEKSMGNPDKNDRGIYDDAMFLACSDHCERFNANTDPSIYRKRIATLMPGVYEYETGFHGITKPNPYPAIRQRGVVVVQRDDVGVDRGHFAINIHKGSKGSTSSEGCQTIHPSQWDEFIGSVYRELGVPPGREGARARKPIWYVLVTKAQLEKIIGRKI